MSFYINLLYVSYTKCKASGLLHSRSSEKLRNANESPLVMLLSWYF